MSSKNETISTSLGLVHVPPLMPQKIALWFFLLERQLAAAGIMNDEEKATALLRCLEAEYLERIEDIMLNLPAIGQYDRLKDELIRIVAELNSERITRLVENEAMGDRKPSQFYHDLKKLASPFASEQFILNLWKNRLPDHIQEVLAVFDDTNVEKLTQIADKVEEVCTRNSQRASDITAVSDPRVQNVGATDPTAAAISTLREKVKQLDARIDALSIDSR